MGDTAKTTGPLPGLQDLLARVDMYFNRSLLAQENPILTRETLTPNSTPRLSDVSIPWYRRNGIPVIHGTRYDSKLFPRVESDYPKHGDQPLSVGEVAASIAPAHPWLKAHSIRKDPPSTGCYPAYDIGGGRRLLLDGNHRCISIVRSGIDFKIDLIVINGPVRGDISPALAPFEARRGAGAL
jgi:hypothetical protein